MKTSATAQIFKLQTLFRALVGPNVAARSVSMPTEANIEKTINDNKVVVYSKTTCPFCIKAKTALKEKGIDFLAIELDRLDDMSATQDILKGMTGARSVPRVFVNGKFFGGGDETTTAANNGTLAKVLLEAASKK
ncbi:glutaredoxin-like [Mizuhopecten yessoensis]|uniref:Homer protein-like 2 n=1 Tax=Mizuhopecten yessoensis TaxID=6573 RepID=A0A210Q302_MIZYE|nr:glutaredoxin-like [Mizuhopecten yessoensis]OWF43114.1 Homer protein-like 2 [Mizuhopecten yessoensis]